MRQLAGTDNPPEEITPSPEDIANHPHGFLHSVGGFFRTISGAKLGQQVRENANTRAFVMPLAMKYLEGGEESGIPDALGKILVEKAAQVSDPHLRKTIMALAEHQQQQRDIERTRQSAKANTSPLPQGSPAPLPATPPPMGGGPAILTPPPAPTPVPPMAMTPPPQTPGMPGQGFGMPSTPAVDALMGPIQTTPSGFSISPFGRGQIQAQKTMPIEEATHQVALQRGAQQRDAIKSYLEGTEWYPKLSPRQQAEVFTGMVGKAVNISPELKPQNVPGLVMGSAIGDEKDAFGNPVDPKGFYRTRLLADGTKEYYPETGVTNTKTIPDAKSPTGFSLVTLDRLGNEVHRMPGATPPPAYVPETSSTSSTTQRVVTVDGRVITVPVTSTSQNTKTRSVPGGTTPPTPAPKGKGMTPPPASISNPGEPALPPGARVIGKSPAQYLREIQNQYTPAGQTALQQTAPVLDQVDRAMKMLEPVKNDNQMLEYALKRLGYSVGLASDTSALINNLELGKIVGASRILRGGSRSYEALKQAMIHLPDPKKDSPKLMYEKLQNIRRNLTDINDSVDKFERKFPGMTPPPGTAPKKSLEEHFK